MKSIYQQLTLKNYFDVELARRGRMNENDIRQVTATFVVDTGAEMTVITDELFKQLGFSGQRFRTMGVAGGGTMQSTVSDGVEIHWNDRSYIGEVITIPGQTENLMGNRTLEFLDLGIDTVNGTLHGNHGDKIVHMIR